MAAASLQREAQSSGQPGRWVRGSLTGIRSMALEFPTGLRSELDADLQMAAATAPGQDLPDTRLEGTVTVLRGAYREPLAVVTGLLANLRAARVAARGRERRRPRAPGPRRPSRHRRGHHRRQQLRPVPARRRPPGHWHGGGAGALGPRRAAGRRAAVRRPEHLHHHLRHDRLREPGGHRAEPERGVDDARRRRGHRRHDCRNAGQSERLARGTVGGDRPQSGRAHGAARDRPSSRGPEHGRCGIHRRAGARQLFGGRARLRRSGHRPGHASHRRCPDVGHPERFHGADCGSRPHVPIDVREGLREQPRRHLFTEPARRRRADVDRRIPAVPPDRVAARLR